MAILRGLPATLGLINHMERDYISGILSSFLIMELSVSVDPRLFQVIGISTSERLHICTVSWLRLSLQDRNTNRRVYHESEERTMHRYLRYTTNTSPQTAILVYTNEITSEAKEKNISLLISFYSLWRTGFSVIFHPTVVENKCLRDGRTLYVIAITRRSPILCSITCVSFIDLLSSLIP